MTDEGALATDPPPTSGRDPDAEAGVGELIRAMAEDQWGRTSPSVYETGRLVGLAPWLPGHAERIDHLLRTQRPDGGWGPPEGYALVPTLSATEALLATYRRDGRPADAAAGAALRTLDRWLCPRSGLTLADTPAVDLIVPALVARINEHLDGIDDPPGEDPRRWPDGWPDGLRLPLPAGITANRLVATRRAIAAGAAIPEKLLHALEVVGELARGAPGVRPVAPGTIGASPAATAAWLGGPEPPMLGGPDPLRRGGPGPSGSGAAAARRFLARVIRSGGGVVPCAIPITVFERAWVLGGLVRVGLVPAVPRKLVRGLAAAVGPAGAAAGPGLPADSDTTSVVLYTLARLGEPTAAESLWRYDTGAHFCTWVGEDGSSTSTNAHLLEALGQGVAAGPPGGAHRRDPPGGAHRLDHAGGARHAAVVRRLSDWLCERQLPTGEWHDRWHASPYYATLCAALALDRYGSGPAALHAVARAVDWILDTQRADGSWGRWAGTVEESAYAMQVLLAAGRPTRERVGVAAARGYAYLVDAVGHDDDPPLWHDKDLYAPYAIVRSATLAALKLAQSRPDLMTSTNLSMR